MLRVIAPLAFCALVSGCTQRNGLYPFDGPIEPPPGADLRPQAWREPLPFFDENGTLLTAWTNELTVDELAPMKGMGWKACGDPNCATSRGFTGDTVQKMCGVVSERHTAWAMLVRKVNVPPSVRDLQIKFDEEGNLAQGKPKDPAYYEAIGTLQIATQARPFIGYTALGGKLPTTEERTVKPPFTGMNEVTLTFTVRWTCANSYSGGFDDWTIKNLRLEGLLPPEGQM